MPGNHRRWTESGTVGRIAAPGRAFPDALAAAAIVGAQPRRFASLQNLTQVMRGLHIRLLLDRRGQAAVTLATAEAMLLVLTGLWLWWRKKHWRFGRWRGSAFRVSWDLHSATGIWFALPVLVMAVTPESSFSHRLPFTSRLESRRHRGDALHCPWILEGPL